MKGYALLEVFTPRSIHLLSQTEKVVEQFPDTGCYEGTEEWIRCHELVRIVAAMLSPEFQLSIIDGRYGPETITSYEHSWLIYEEPNQRSVVCYRFILDPYAVGRLPQVQLLDPHAGNHKLYRESNPRDDIRYDHVNRELDRLRQHFGARGIPA